MSIGFMYFLLPSILSLHLKSYCQTLQKFVILFHSKTSESSWHRNDQTPAKRSEICYACQCHLLYARNSFRYAKGVLSRENIKL